MPQPPFNELLGTKFIAYGDGSSTCELELTAQHTNKRGVAHGGVVAALLDSALGGAVMSSIPREWWCATTSLTINFVSGGTGTLTASGKLMRRGHRVAFAGGEVRDSRDRLVATAQGTWHLWTARPGTPERAAPGHVLMQDGSQLRVGKILAVGRNYAEHRAEMGAPAAGPPLLFLKPATALHHGSPLPIPTDAGEVHHEVELVALIGKAGRRIAVEQALEHVQGYAVGVDLTLRDVQSAAKQAGGPWSQAKGFDASAPVGRFVPREEVGDGSGLAIRLSVNGESRQQADTAQMQRSVAELIHFASRWLRLERGDLLFTGTPAGVGPLVPGDRVEASIDGVGELAFELIAEDEHEAARLDPVNDLAEDDA